MKKSKVTNAETVILIDAKNLTAHLLEISEKIYMSMAWIRKMIEFDILELLGCRDWILPSRQPDRTTVYKNRALRTPFVKLGHNSTLRIEIDDHVVQDIESLIFDDTHNKW
ncbi:hypothetical protein ZEAMMB73_Zm00001d006727 [Zea mays]|uniref:Alpha-glucan water dikinase-like N-terminal Ig-like domain-containing protein n=1 Tax=Zea mays TaxID=4577 RepID=A0A1D6EZW2_MAIZE|nr:hypothetical protein ZEAMMB73_Zm00001d006727 [Zea mays]ONM24842.1 hypothetical protein ZEAMMB73_Zm00001d006727 [Zea mays]